MRRGLLIGLMLFAGAPFAWAQNIVASEHADAVSVTIYRDDIALISETRTVDLPAGPAIVQFRDVSSTMVSQTADVSGLPEKVNERNFDFNLLSPGSLIQKSIGETVHVVRTNPKTGASRQEDAVLRSGPNGVVMQIGDRVEALNCSGLPERLVFDHIPAGLYDTPTLTVRTNVPRAGRYTITLRYIATGLNWSADYVARIARDDQSLDLSGWITLANSSETSFRDAPVSVIAGQVQTTGDDRALFASSLSRADFCWPTKINWASIFSLVAAPAPNGIYGGPGGEMVTVTGTSIRGQAPVGANVISVDRNIVARDLGDLKLYPLPETTTVAARQTKQVQFLDKTAVPFRRIYRSDNFGTNLSSSEQEKPVPVSILLRLQNTEAGGLGKPLPAGGISASVDVGGDVPIPVSYQEDVHDTPVGLPLEIPAGSTSEIIATRKVISSVAATENRRPRRRTTLEVTIVNTKQKPVNFEWAQALYDDTIKFVSETRSHTTKNGYLIWTLPLKPGEQAVFQYTLNVPGS